MAGRRRFVARGVPGGYQIWDNARRRYWGEPYEFLPDELLAERNGEHRPERIAELMRRARAMRR